jgi:hypothetical protein
MNGGILQDFSYVIGLQPDGSLWIPAETEGKKLSMYQTEFLRLCNVHLKNNPEIHQFLLFEFHRSRFLSKQQGQHHLSPAKRRELLERFEDQNRDAARQYLHGADDRLFCEPWPAPDEPWEPFPGLIVEELVPIITELIYEQEGRWEHPEQPLRVLCDCVNNILKKGAGRAPSENHGPASQQQFVREVSFRTGKSGPAYQPEKEPQNSRTVDELVPMVAERMYRRNQRLQESQPLGTVMVLVNHLLARIFGLVPPRKKDRIHNMLTGEWFHHE